MLWASRSLKAARQGDASVTLHLYAIQREDIKAANVDI